MFYVVSAASLILVILVQEIEASIRDCVMALFEPHLLNVLANERRLHLKHKQEAPLPLRGQCGRN